MICRSCRGARHQRSQKMILCSKVLTQPVSSTVIDAVGPVFCMNSSNTPIFITINVNHSKINQVPSKDSEEVILDEVTTRGSCSRLSDCIRITESGMTEKPIKNTSIPQMAGMHLALK